MTRLSFPLGTAAIIAVLLLSGCSDQNGLKALHRAATPEDKLPAGITLSPEANPETARLLATDNGVKYFGAENDDGTVACVVTVPRDGAWAAGCSSTNVTGRIVEVSVRDGASSTMLVTDDYDTQKLESSGWTKIAENVLIAGG